MPVVGCVTRLTHQKGIHLIKHAAWRTVERGGQFVLLGSAPEPKVQAEFQELSNDLAAQYPDRARLWFAYDEPLRCAAAAPRFAVPCSAVCAVCVPVRCVRSAALGAARGGLCLRLVPAALPDP